MHLILSYNFSFEYTVECKRYFTEIAYIYKLFHIFHLLAKYIICSHDTCKKHVLTYTCICTICLTYICDKYSDHVAKTYMNVRLIPCWSDSNLIYIKKLTGPMYRVKR